MKNKTSVSRETNDVTEFDKNKKYRCSECSWRGLAGEMHQVKGMGVCPRCHKWHGLVAL